MAESTGTIPYSTSVGFASSEAQSKAIAFSIR